MIGEPRMTTSVGVVGRSGADVREGLVERSFLGVPAIGTLMVAVIGVNRDLRIHHAVNIQIGSNVVFRNVGNIVALRVNSIVLPVGEHRPHMATLPVQPRTADRSSTALYRP